MTAPVLNADRMMARLHELGEVGRGGDGRLVRVAATDADRDGRNLFVSWLEDAGLDVVIDKIGNVFGVWRTGDLEARPLMVGSHIDTVVNAGIYDGCYGVIAGLEVIQALKTSGFKSTRPIMVGAFTNEEGARFTPDMMGSLVFAGGLDLAAALARQDADGKSLGDELARIGYAGSLAPGFATPYAYLELHIEQGPVLERESIAIGAVENLQGISWQRVTIEGDANHAGTTPMSMRRDAGHAAAKAITHVREFALKAAPGGVATVGSLTLAPNVINVIPSRATFTVDLRHTDDSGLHSAEADLAAFLLTLEESFGVHVSVERLARFEPVRFDASLCRLIEAKARERGLTVRPITSGAGHDAQMIARMCPSAMVFVPSRNGISHNPREYTEPDHLRGGAAVFLDVVAAVAAGGWSPT